MKHLKAVIFLLFLIAVLVLPVVVYFAVTENTKAQNHAAESMDKLTKELQTFKDTPQKVQVETRLVK